MTRPPDTKSPPGLAGRLRRALPRLIKFAVVGFSGVAVNMGAFWVLHTLVLTNFADTTRASLASAVAVAVSICTNFLLNDAWTWRDRRDRSAHTFAGRAIRYIGVASLAGGIQVGVVAVWVGWFGWNELLGNFVGIAAGVVLNFVANHFWTFAPKEDGEPPSDTNLETE